MANVARTALIRVLSMIVMGVVLLSVLSYAIIERDHSPSGDEKPNARDDAEEDRNQPEFMKVVAQLSKNRQNEFAEQPEAKEHAEVKWHIGGTLHAKTALDWQTASDADKLATCADFISAEWAKKRFVPPIQDSIKSTDDMKPFAKLLVNYLDKATIVPDDLSDDDFIRSAFESMKLSKLAVSGMISMDWMKRTD